MAHYLDPPTYEDFLDWWEYNGNPPITQEAAHSYYGEITIFIQALSAEIWQAGNIAPYPLYPVQGSFVEATAADIQPIINRGDVIPPDLAVQLQALITPAKPESIVLADDYAENVRASAEHGEIDPATFIGIHADPDGTVRIYEPTPEPLLLSWIEPPVSETP